MSYSLVYTGKAYIRIKNLISLQDTDSIVIACTGSQKIKENSCRHKMEAIFLPLVRENEMENFKKNWENWICLSDDVSEQRKPGLLKIEFLESVRITFSSFFFNFVFL